MIIYAASYDAPIGLFHVSGTNITCDAPSDTTHKVIDQCTLSPGESLERSDYERLMRGKIGRSACFFAHPSLCDVIHSWNQGFGVVPCPNAPINTLFLSELVW